MRFCRRKKNILLFEDIIPSKSTSWHRKKLGGMGFLLHHSFFANSLQNCKFIVTMNQSSFPLNLYLVLCTYFLIGFFMSFGDFFGILTPPLN